MGRYRDAVAALALVAVFAMAAASPGKAQDERLFPELSPDDEEITVFVLGNTLFTVFHEIGHALIHHYQLPVLGREEDAVDGLAAILMIPETPDPLLDAMIIAAADGWLLTAEDNGIADLAYWDEHSLDEQRFYSIACLIVGSDPEGFYDYARDVGLPEDRIDSCPYTYQQMRGSWRTLLEPFLREKGASGRGRVLVSWEPAPAGLRDARDFVRESAIAKTAATAIEGLLALPEDVPLAFESCDVANAFFDPATGGVTFCYELVAEFERLIREDIARR